MTNTVLLVGRIARDPESRDTQGGTTVTSLSVVTDRPARNKEGELGQGGAKGVVGAGVGRAGGERGDGERQRKVGDAAAQPGGQCGNVHGQGLRFKLGTADVRCVFLMTGAD